MDKGEKKEFWKEFNIGDKVRIEFSVGIIRKSKTKTIEGEINTISKEEVEVLIDTKSWINNKIFRLSKDLVPIDYRDIKNYEIISKYKPI